MTEEWKKVAGSKNYSVSNRGRVRRDNTGLILKGGISSAGYRIVSLCEDGRQKTRSVHQMVCDLFCGRRPSSAHEVAHYDGDKLHNDSGNLRWATSAENRSDARRHGRIAHGEQHGRAKLTSDQVAQIRQLLAVTTASAIARQFNVSSPTIDRIKHGHTWMCQPQQGETI